MWSKAPLLAALLGAGSLLAQSSRPAVGLFESHADVGETPQKGSVVIDVEKDDYRVTGGGANVWANTDAFHYVYTRVTGDVTITADVAFVGKGAVAHRKAMLMVRQSLAP